MIEVKNLEKVFGNYSAVSDVSFNVKRGEVLGFLGPNGAGKSTTMKMLAGFLNPTSGTAIICGNDVLKNPMEVKKSMGYLPEGAPAYGDMTALTFLSFIADIRGYSGEEKTRRINRVVEITHLEKILNQTIETLSKGFKRRVGIAQAILHDPEVLIMDEPTDGLDPNQKHEVRALIQNMAKDKAIIISTHILEEVNAICDRAIIIAQGKLLFDGTPDELEAKSRYHNAVNLVLTTNTAGAIAKKLKQTSGVADVEFREARPGTFSFRVVAKNGQSIIKDVNNSAQENGWQFEALNVETGHLDEVFRDITSVEIEGDARS